MEFNLTECAPTGVLFPPSPGRPPHEERERERSGVNWTRIEMRARGVAREDIIKIKAFAILIYDSLCSAYTRAGLRVSRIINSVSGARNEIFYSTGERENIISRIVCEVELGRYRMRSLSLSLCPSFSPPFRV